MNTDDAGSPLSVNVCVFAGTVPMVVKFPLGSCRSIANPVSSTLLSTQVIWIWLADSGVASTLNGDWARWRASR